MLRFEFPIISELALRAGRRSRRCFARGLVTLVTGPSPSDSLIKLIKRMAPTAKNSSQPQKSRPSLEEYFLLQPSSSPGPRPSSSQSRPFFSSQQSRPKPKRLAVPNVARASTQRSSPRKLSKKSSSSSAPAAIIVISSDSGSEKPVTRSPRRRSTSKTTPSEVIVITSSSEGTPPPPTQTRRKSPSKTTRPIIKPELPSRSPSLSRSSSAWSGNLFCVRVRTDAGDFQFLQQHLQRPNLPLANALIRSL